MNTNKTSDHIPLFILIWSFKTGSLCWTLMTFEDRMSSHRIAKWLWRSASGFVVTSRLSKHLHTWISTHLLDNVFHVLLLIWLSYYPHVSCLFVLFLLTDCLYFSSSLDFFLQLLYKNLMFLKYNNILKHLLGDKGTLELGS